MKRFVIHWKCSRDMKERICQYVGISEVDGVTMELHLYPNHPAIEKLQTLARKGYITFRMRHQ